MKRNLIIFLALLLALPALAQQKNGFVSFQAGPSFPLAGFNDKELPDGGFALTGMNLSLEGAWYFLPWLGTGLNASMNLHPVDAGAIGIAKLAANPFYTALVIRSDPYKSFALNAGLFFRYPLARKLTLTAKALGGLMYAETPYQLHKAEYYLVGKNWFEITSAGDYEATFLAGAGLRYDLNDCIGFTLQSEFTYNAMEFSFLQAGGAIRTENITFSFINLNAGVFFKIPYPGTILQARRHSGTPASDGFLSAHSYHLPPGSK